MKPLFESEHESQEFLTMAQGMIYQKVKSTRNSEKVVFSDLELSHMTGGRYRADLHKTWLIDHLNHARWFITGRDTPDIMGRVFNYPTGIYLSFSPQVEGYLFRYAFPLTTHRG